MIPQFPCSVCRKSIGEKENSVFYNLCKLLFILIAITSIMLTISIYQPAMILGIVLIVPLKYMLLAI